MASCDLTEWAGRILATLPSGIATTGSIADWLLYSPFRLNAVFGTDYSTSGSCVTPTLTTNHSGVYEEMWMCNLYHRLAMQSLGVNAFDVEDLVEAEADGQGRLRFVSRNEKSKTYRSYANDCEARLKALIDDLNRNTRGSVVVGQVLYGDRTNMKFGDNCYCPGPGFEHNTVFSQFYTYK